MTLLQKPMKDLQENLRKVFFKLYNTKVDYECFLNILQRHMIRQVTAVVPPHDGLHVKFNCLNYHCVKTDNQHIS